MIKGSIKRAASHGALRGAPDATRDAQLPQTPRSRGALAAIKAVHVIAWFSIESCMIYLLYAGLTKRSDRRAAIAGLVVGGESLIFLANGFHCPLTRLAEKLGAKRGSVTDIYLPKWFAHNLPAIHAPLLVLAAFLHVRNVRVNLKPARPSARGPGALNWGHACHPARAASATATDVAGIKKEC